MRVLLALHELAKDRGDVKSLEPPLAGGYRIILAYGKRQTIACVFAEQRSVV